MQENPQLTLEPNAASLFRRAGLRCLGPSVCKGPGEGAARPEALAPLALAFKRKAASIHQACTHQLQAEAWIDQK